MKKLLLLLVLLVTAFAGYHFITNDSQRIQRDITLRLSEALNINGFGKQNLNMTVSGRDVTLEGVVADTATKAGIGDVAKKLYGVRAVDNNIQVAGASKPIPTPVIEEPAINFDVELPQAPEIVENPFAVAPVIVQREEVVAEPTMELQPVLQQETVVVMSEPVITYVEEEPTHVVRPVAPKITLNGPLPIKNGQVVRRQVDRRIAAKTVEAACEDDLTSLMWNNKILFDSAKATIQSKSYALLDKLVVAAKNCDKNTIITINGYTDNEGDAEYNRKLSLDRARAVGKYMLKRGVAKRVKVVGNGENSPIASNDTEDGKAQNRRIEFRVFTD